MAALRMAVIAAAAAVHAGVCFQVQYSITHAGEFEKAGPPGRQVTLRSPSEENIPQREAPDANVEVVRLAERHENLGSPGRQVTLHSPIELNMPQRETPDANVEVVRLVERQEIRRPSVATAVLAGAFALAAAAKLMACVLRRLLAVRCCVKRRHRDVDGKIVHREDIKLQRVRGDVSPHSEPDAEHADDSSDDEACEAYDFVVWRSASEDESETLQCTSVRCTGEQGPGLKFLGGGEEGPGLKFIGGGDKLAFAEPEFGLADLSTDEPEPDLEPGADSCDEASGIELSAALANTNAFDMARI